MGEDMSAAQKFRFERCPSETVSIYIGGAYEDIVRVAQRYCEKGLCVSVFPCTFAYRYGREEGAEVRLINYPRFPTDAMNELMNEGLALAEVLMEELSQGSVSVQGPSWTTWLSRRSPDLAEKPPQPV